MKAQALLGPLKCLEDGDRGQQLPTHLCFPVYNDPVGLGGTVVQVDIDTRKSNPHVLERTDEGDRCRPWALRLPWPRALLASGLLAGLIKPLLQHLRRWGPGRIAEKARERGGGSKGHCMVRPGV